MRIRIEISPLRDGTGRYNYWIYSQEKDDRFGCDLLIEEEIAVGAAPSKETAIECAKAYIREEMIPNPHPHGTPEHCRKNGICYWCGADVEHDTDMPLIQRSLWCHTCEARANNLPKPNKAVGSYVRSGGRV